MVKSRGIIEIAEMIEGIHNNKGKRIIMEKEKNGLTYKEMLDKLVEYNSKYEDYDESSFKKALNCKKINEDLVKDLYFVLNLKETDLSEDMAVYRYNNKSPLIKGRPSKSKIEEDIKRYDESHLEHDPENGIYDMDRLIVEALETEEVYKIGDEIFEGYLEYAYEIENRDMLKRMFLIFSCFPNEVKEFMDYFKFNEEEEKEFKKLDVQIKYI